MKCKTKTNNKQQKQNKNLLSAKICSNKVEKKFYSKLLEPICQKARTLRVEELSDLRFLFATTLIDSPFSRQTFDELSVVQVPVSLVF